MPTPQHIDALVDRIRCVQTEEEKNELIGHLAQTAKPSIVSFVNAHAVNLCWHSDAVLAAFQASDLLLRDGIGLKLALSALGRPVGLNMNGTDFIPLLLHRLPPRRVALYGTETPWLEAARDRLAADTLHDYADVQHGFHDDEHYVACARRTRPDVIVLAMGMPRQERAAARLKAELDHPALIINGGAIMDFLARRFERAPVYVQRAGLEWAYRLAQEPRRLSRRYLVGGVGFVRNVMILRRLAGARAAGAQAQGV